MAEEADALPLIDKLFVLWSEATEPFARHVVGTLWRDQHGYAFAYVPDLPFSRGFSLLAEFPEHRTSPSAYRSATLFPTFAQRIPSPRRLDFERIMKSWGASGSRDAFQILAFSGGAQMTDALELAEYRPADDDLSRPLQFRIAGERFHHGADQLTVDERVELRRDPENPKDARATLVLARTGERVGYVPRQYAELIARLLDSGAVLDAKTVRRLTLPDSRDRWVVRVQRLS